MIEEKLEALRAAHYSPRRKILISLFILFHFGCLIAWVLPKPSPIKTCLLGLSLPLPGLTREAGEQTSLWAFKSRPFVAEYLYHTAQWQDWAMFAPNPVQTNQYLGAHVIYERGNWKEYTLPHLDQMNWVESWIEKRYRKLKNRLIDEKRPEFYEDLARWIARQESQPGNRVARVSVILYDSPIPRHDRKDLGDPHTAPWINYTELLREKATYSPTLVLDYFVKPGDLE